MTKFVRYLCAEFAPALAIMALLGASLAHADEADLRFQGFASQRLTSSSGKNNFFGDTRGKLSADYTEIGAGVSWRPHPQWLLSGQAIYRRGGASEKEEIEPDYYYAAYTPWESEAGHLTLKLGKIKVPYGLYNDMRDTPMTRPGILAPQSIYRDSLRQLNQAASGIHLEAERNLGDDTFTLRLSQIKPSVHSENTFWSFLGSHTTFTGELYSRNNEAFAGQLAYDHDGGRLRAMVSYAQAQIHYRPGSADNYSVGKFDTAFSALSLQWNGEQVSLSGEIARNDFKNRFVSVGLPYPDIASRNIGTSSYAQVQWRFAPQWEALLRYDVVYADNDDRDGTAYAANPLNGGNPAWSRFVKDWTIGLRHRLDSHWLLAGELHRVHGTSWLPAADNLTNGQWVPGNTSPNWNLFLLQATYQF
ncbi:MAG: OprO/OprP family phosphate-selective porin [Gammaproteobacteria bacterium]|nr:OprO/OprP family phosphate-selective porin [Gammaproteobacteria bacterium]